MFDNVRKFYLFPSALAVQSVDSLEALFNQLKREYDDINSINGNGTSNINGINGSTAAAAASKCQLNGSGVQGSSLSADVKPTSHPTLNGGSNKANQVTPDTSGQSQSYQPNQLQNPRPIRYLKEKKQRLLLLRHAAKCPHSSGCPVTPHCAEMKALWKHIADCKDRDCKVRHCMSSRHVLNHYRACKDVRCELCGPVNEAKARSREAIKQTKELDKKSKKRKASSSPADGAPPSKRNSINDDAKYAADLQQLEEQWAREDKGCYQQRRDVPISLLSV